jgi:hypothetical protein
MSDRRETLAGIIALGIASEDHPRIIADSVLEWFSDTEAVE